MKLLNLINELKFKSSLVKAKTSFFNKHPPPMNIYSQVPNTRGVLIVEAGGQTFFRKLINARGGLIRG